MEQVQTAQTTEIPTEILDQARKLMEKRKRYYCLYCRPQGVRLWTKYSGTSLPKNLAVRVWQSTLLAGAMGNIKNAQGQLLEFRLRPS